MNEIQKLAPHLAAIFEDDEYLMQFLEMIAARNIKTRKQLLDLDRNILTMMGLPREGYEFIKRVEEREKMRREQEQGIPRAPEMMMMADHEEGQETTTRMIKEQKPNFQMFDRVTFENVFKKPEEKDEEKKKMEEAYQLNQTQQGTPMNTFEVGQMAKPDNAFASSTGGIRPQQTLGGGFGQSLLPPAGGFGQTGGFGQPGGFVQLNGGIATGGFGQLQGFGQPKGGFGQPQGGFGTIGFGSQQSTNVHRLRAIWGEEAYIEEEEVKMNFHYDEKSEKIIFTSFSNLKSTFLDYAIIPDRDGNYDLTAILPFVPCFEQRGYVFEDKEEEAASELIREYAKEALNSTECGWYEQIDQLGEYNEKDEVHVLLKLIYKHAKGCFERAEENIKKGQIDFRNLWHLFKKKTPVLITDPDMKKQYLGGTIQGMSIQGGEYFSQHLVMSVETYSTNGQYYELISETSTIDHFTGMVNIDDLDILLLERKPEIKEKLVERGKRWVKLSKGNHYFNYEGTMCRKRFWTLAEEEATGRIMLDEASYAKQETDLDTGAANYPQRRQKFSFNNNVARDEEGIQTLKEEELWMTPSYVRGFSFVNKRWGCFLIDNIKPLKYNKEAFEMLVLDEHKKEIINALVTYGEEVEYSDIVEHKGNGCLFLLHGPPGVGKTLTAEAIAEYLERPIYPVSVGELGTSPIVLEKNLADIVEMATLWNAVVLIDEADIFLERRSETDIVRNAMVGVFLRVVEYFKGVLFLTSNRVRCLDRAMHSRVTAALKYPALNENARKIIWGHFMKIVARTFELKIDPEIDIDGLSKIDINGRQIRSVMRLAASLALDDHATLLQEKHIRDCIDISNHFQDFVASSALTKMMDESEPEDSSSFKKEIWVNKGKLRSLNDTF